MQRFPWHLDQIEHLHHRFNTATPRGKQHSDVARNRDWLACRLADSEIIIFLIVISEAYYPYQSYYQHEQIHPA